MKHRDLTGANIHVPHAFEYADATARAAATGFVPADVGKFARQLDDNTFWMLTDDDPATWVQIGGAIAADLDISALPEETTPASGDYFVVDRSGTRKKVDFDNMPTGVDIPGLAGSPDIAGAGGTSFSQEFDTSTDPFTWSTPPDTVSSHNTIASHLYMTNNDNTIRYGLLNWVPGSGVFDIRVKIAIGSDSSATNNNGAGISIQNSDGTSRVLLWFINSVSSAPLGHFEVQAYTYAPSVYTQRGSTHIVYDSEIYLRITRDGSNNISFWYSTNGKIWRFITTYAFTITVAKAGLRTSADSTINSYFAVDWLRASV